MSEDAMCQIPPDDDRGTGEHRLRVRVDGPESGSPLVLVHMLGTDLTLWDGLMPALERFRVIRFDVRGHGGSAVGEAGFGIDRLGRDVLDILDAMNIERVHFCGLSMGGAIGLWLLVHAPERIDRAIIAGAAAKLGTPAGWNARIAAALSEGMDEAVVSAIDRFFSPAFVERSAADVEPLRAMIAGTSVAGYVACCAALRDMDLREALRGVTTPVLVLRGAHDPSVSAEDADELVAAMEGATSVELDARHCASIEDRDGFAAAVVKFLTAKTVKAAPRRRAAAVSARTGKGARAPLADRRLGGRGLVAARRSVATKSAAKMAPVKASGVKGNGVKASGAKRNTADVEASGARNARAGSTAPRTKVSKAPAPKGRPAASQSAASRRTGAKAAAQKPAANKPAAKKATAPKPAAAKMPAAKMSAAKTSRRKPGAGKAPPPARGKAPAKAVAAKRAEAASPRTAGRAKPASPPARVARASATRTGASLKAAAGRAATRPGAKTSARAPAVETSASKRKPAVAKPTNAKSAPKKSAAGKPGPRKSAPLKPSVRKPGPRKPGPRKPGPRKP